MRASFNTKKFMPFRRRLRHPLRCVLRSAHVLPPHGCHRKALAAGESVKNMASRMMTARPPRAYCPQTHMRCPKGCLVISRSRAKGATTRASNQRAESRAVNSSSCPRTTSLPARGLSHSGAERNETDDSTDQAVRCEPLTIGRSFATIRRLHQCVIPLCPKGA